MHVAQIPETLEDAVKLVTEMEGAEEWAKETDDANSAGAMIHHFAGMAIRNEWGLWCGMPLARHLYERFGLAHADDMSGLIFHCAWKELNGQPWDVEPVIERYRRHWERYSDGMPKPTWEDE